MAADKNASKKKAATAKPSKSKTVKGTGKSKPGLDINPK
jgi:hypothetical protein